MTLAMASNASGVYAIQESLRIKSGAHFQKTYATSRTSTQKQTISLWFKRSAITDASPESLIYGYDGTSTFTSYIYLNADDTMTASAGGTSGASSVTTSQVFRDPFAWYHVVFAIDTTQAVASDRLKLYINGSQVTAFSSTTYPTQNWPTNFFYTGALNGIGYDPNTGNKPFSGYIADFYGIDGQQLTAASFGVTDAQSGMWRPIRYTGTYGNNGFYLPFTNASTATALGFDYSGNGNNWTPTSISVAAGADNDSVTDVPNPANPYAGNFCTLNPMIGTAGATSAGNLKYSTTVNALTRFLYGTIGFSSGKWYWEVTPTDVSLGNVIVGIMLSTGMVASDASQNSLTANGYGYDKGGNKINGTTRVAYGATWTNNDVVGVALDMDAGTITFYKNGASQGVAYSGLVGTYVPLYAYSYSSTGATSAGSFNFGQQPFAYTPPSGHLPLNSFNAPAVIPFSNKYITSTLYTGTGANLTVVNSGPFQPDLVWVKSRSASTDHKLTDSVRGVTKAIITNTTGAETTDTTGLTAFNSNGFTLGNSTTYNNTAATYVGWQWQGGQGVTVNNTAGSIAANVSASTTAGFSIVQYVGTATNATVGHGLNSAPQLIIVKNTTSATGAWAVYHSALGNTKYSLLNTTDLPVVSGGFWNNTSPTSSVFSIGTNGNVNANANNVVAYCWAAIDGFSSFGSYVGNASTDGPQVYTGFRPQFVLIKNTGDNTTNWRILDSAINPYNVEQTDIYPNSSGPTGTTLSLDVLCNGFKIRGSGVGVNGSGNTMIYAAFAQNPFKYALAR